jgi:F0F1-type ATP synthase assembly protein I
MTGAGRASTERAKLFAGLKISSLIGGSMFGALLFIACLVLQFHYHDSIPWYIWVLAVIGVFVSWGEPAMKLKKE